MNTKIKVIAGAVGAAVLLVAAYAIGVHSPSNSPGVSQMPAAGIETTGPSTAATVPVTRELPAVLSSGSSAATNLPTNGSLEPTTQVISPTSPFASPQTSVVTSRTTTATERSPRIAYRAVAVRRVRHEAPGNIHVSRALKHAVGFTAEFPFRLRP